MWDNNLTVHPTIELKDDIQRLVKRMRGSILFIGLPKSHLEKISNLFIEVFVGAGEAILEEGDPVRTRRVSFSTIIIIIIFYLYITTLNLFTLLVSEDIIRRL